MIDRLHDRRINVLLVAKGQKMGMKNYAKQLNAQIEEVVAEVSDWQMLLSFRQCISRIDPKSIGQQRSKEIQYSADHRCACERHHRQFRSRQVSRLKTVDC